MPASSREETKQKVHRYKVRETDDYRGAGKRNGDEIADIRSQGEVSPGRQANDGQECRRGRTEAWQALEARRRRQSGDGFQKESRQQARVRRRPGTAGKRQEAKQLSNDGIENTNRKKDAKRIDDQSNDGQKLTKKQKREAEKQKKKKQRNQDVSTENQQGSADRQSKKKKRNQGSSNQDQLGVMDSQGGDNSNQGKKKKKRNQDASSENSQNSSGFSNQQEKKKKRNQTSGVESDGQSQSGNNKKRKKSGCDPNSGECQ